MLFPLAKHPFSRACTLTAVQGSCAMRYTLWLEFPSQFETLALLLIYFFMDWLNQNSAVQYFISAGKKNPTPKPLLRWQFPSLSIRFISALKQLFKSSAVRVRFRVKVKDELVSTEASPVERHSSTHSYLMTLKEVWLTFCFPTMLSNGSSGLQDPSVNVAPLFLLSEELTASFTISSGKVNRLSSGCLIK